MSWEVSLQMRVGTLELDVDIEGGEGPMALVGPNGSGKTTLLRTIAGAHRPASGRIRLGDEAVFDSERGIDLPPEKRHVGYVPQGYGLFPHLTVIENVAFGWISRRPKLSRQQRREAAMELMLRMGCDHLAERTPPTLSGGELQRVALARALTIEPQILLLDEPLAALDAPAKRSVRSYLADHLDQSGAPAIVVSHDARDVVALGAEVCVLEGGSIVQRGSAEALTMDPATEFVAAFFDSDVAVHRTT